MGKQKLPTEINVVGLMNTQLAIKDKKIYVLRSKPKSQSEQVPFVAKATGIPIAKIAAKVMVGENLKAGFERL